MKKPWTQREVDFVIAQRGRKASSVAISRVLGRTRSSVENKIKQLIASEAVTTIPKENQSEVLNFISKLEPSPEPDYTKFFEITGDFMSVSDIHTPFHHSQLLKYLMRIAVKFGIRNLIINGDFLNGDAFTTYCTPNRGRESMEREFGTAEKLLESLLRIFGAIYLTMGNHEIRFFKALGGQANPSRFMRMLNVEMGKKFKVSDYPYAIVRSAGVPYLVGHPDNFCGRGGQVPADIADKFQMNTILGHNHQFGIQMSLSGKWMGIDQGMGADAKKIEYYMKDLNKFRVWQNGFSMVKNGKPYVFNLNFTDWGWWLK